MKSPLARTVADLALNLHLRPSDLIELEGSALERLLFDAAILRKAFSELAPPTSTRGRIEQRRRMSGLYT